jgi:hypothetical protein
MLAGEGARILNIFVKIRVRDKALRMVSVKKIVGRMPSWFGWW